ncbi:MAG TPA: nucleotidyltransferase domain-containing protein [bacterium]|nr:nucleotidyltransferase domain-containing protein [bacterium]
MNKTGARELVRRFVSKKLPEFEWYGQTLEHLKAIIFYGSRARETNRPDSDVDILFIMPLEIEKKFTKGEYSYDFQGYEINIVIRSIERLRQIAHERHDPFQSEVFRCSEVIWDKDHEVSELIEKIVQGNDD